MKFFSHFFSFIQWIPTLSRELNQEIWRNKSNYSIHKINLYPSSVVVLNKGWFCSPDLGTLGNVYRCFRCHNSGDRRSCHGHVVSRNLLWCYKPPMHSSAPAAKTYVAPNIHSAAFGLAQHSMFCKVLLLLRLLLLTTTLPSCRRVKPNLAHPYVRNHVKRIVTPMSHRNYKATQVKCQWSWVKSIT